MLKSFKTKGEILKEAMLKARASVMEGRKAFDLKVEQAKIKQRQEEKATRTGKAKRAARRSEHEAREKTA